MTVPQARAEARNLIATLHRTGEERHRTPDYPKAAFAGEFLERQAWHWKHSTQETNAYLVHNHILPAFGHMTVDAVAAEHVKDWSSAMTDQAGATNRAMSAPSVMTHVDELWDCLPLATPTPASGPVTTGRSPRSAPDGGGDGPTQRRAHSGPIPLSPGRHNHPPADADRVPRRKTVSLEWNWIRGKRIFLPDSKPGLRSVPPGEAAWAVIEGLPRPRDSNTLLFPNNAQTRCPDNSVDCWQTVREEAKLGRVRLHDLRHAAASHAVMSGDNIPLVGKLLGHCRHETTADYVHLTDAHLVEAAERIESLTAAAMEGYPDSR